MEETYTFDLQDDDGDYMPPNKKRKGATRYDSDYEYNDEEEVQEIESKPPVVEPPPTTTTTKKIKKKSDATEEASSAAPSGEKKSNAIQYHCDYCRKDISETVRIKCAVCTDFDLCVECFSVGVEIVPHKNSHGYQVMDNMHFPLLHPDWGADEEILLLEAIEMYGLGNWGDVGEHVGTKNAAECKTHYLDTYINAPTAPLPDTSKVLTTSSTLLANVKRMREVLAEQKQDKAKALPVATKTTPKVSNKEIHAALVDSMGYMRGRNEFETEYDNEAEVVIRDISFEDDDDQGEKEMKLKVLEIYNSRLDERARRRKFIIDNGLLDHKKLQQQDKRRNKEDREVYNNLRVFLQVMTKDEHEQLLAGITAERNLKRRIQQLQTWRANGIHTLAEGELFEIETQRRESSLRRAKDNSSYMYYADKQRASSRGERYRQREREENIATKLDKIRARPRKPGQPLDLDGVVGVEMLSTQERVLCSNVRILPKQYLLIKDTLLAEYGKSGYLKKSTARSLVKIDVNKTARIFEFFEQSGWINRQNSTQQQQQMLQMPQQMDLLQQPLTAASVNIPMAK